MPLVAHWADLHIGAAFDSLPPEASEICRNAQLAALDAAIDQVNDIMAEALLIAGDLFDSPSPPPALFSRVISALSRAYCPVLVSPGNHDYFHPQSPYSTASIPENIHIFQSTQLEAIPINKSFVVWGGAFCDITARIPPTAPLDLSQINLLCMHAELNENNHYNPITPATLAPCGYDYAAFGHNHVYSGIRHTGDTAYACPGSFCSRGVHEPGEHGWLLLDVTKSAIKARFVPTQGIRFETFSLSISDITDNHTLGQAVAALIPECHDHACLTLVLEGERTYSPDLAGLSRALSQICVHATLRDRTSKTFNPWRYESLDDLRGAVTRGFREQFDAAQTDSDRQARLYALKIALAALDGAPFPE